MEKLFLQICSMSLTAGYVILAVLLVRLLLQKAPRKYVLLLWAAPAFRMLCPLSFVSAFSLFSLRPFDMAAAQSASGGARLEHIPPDIGLMAQPRLHTGLEAVNGLAAESLPAATPMYSANPMQIWVFIGMCIWLLGMALLFAYAAFGYLRTARRVREAVLLEGTADVYAGDAVQSPFILGLLRPKIYVPRNLDAAALEHVLLHERCHIRSLDHWLKPFAFLLLTLHWFNPLAWLAFFLMGRDMELRCDERLLAEHPGIRADYSETLLSFAAPRRFPAAAGPLAFGESAVKTRIQKALLYKKPGRFAALAAALVCLCALIACTANPKSALTDAALLEDAYGLALGAATFRGMELIKEEGQLIRSADGERVTLRFPAKGGGSALVEYELTDDAGRRGNQPYRAVVSVNGPDAAATQTPAPAPAQTPAPGETLPLVESLSGALYESSRCIFMHPLSSFYPFEGDSGLAYYLDGESFLILRRDTGDITLMHSLLDGRWTPLKESEEAWAQSLFPDTDAVVHPGARVNMESYANPLYRNLGGGWYLLDMDGELWILETHENERMGRYVWSIYALRPLGECDALAAAHFAAEAD